MVLRNGFMPVAAGMIAGLAGSLAVGRVLSGVLIGVSPFDPLTYIGVTVLLGAVALTASLMPARRATGVDPMIALRHE
jgi:ABC-type antimicrobial peptide transport system permease subunit